MLRNLRQSEERLKDGSHIIFLLQEPDLRYLVENIWGGQSVLSAVRDVFELTLARWDKREQWAPWNCVLMTKDEAKAHAKLTDIEEVPFNRVYSWGAGQGRHKSSPLHPRLLVMY